MEQSLWTRFRCFVAHALTQKFKAFFPGSIMGFIGGQHLLFTGFPVSVVSYVYKFLGTVILAFFSGLATTWAAKIIERRFEVKDQRRGKRRR